MEFVILYICPFLDLVLICSSFRRSSLSAPPKPAGTGRAMTGGRCGLVVPYRGEQNRGFGESSANTTSAMRAFNTPAIGS